MRLKLFLIIAIFTLSCTEKRIDNEFYRVKNQIEKLLKKHNNYLELTNHLYENGIDIPNDGFILFFGPQLDVTDEFLIINYFTRVKDRFHCIKLGYMNGECTISDKSILEVKDVDLLLEKYEKFNISDNKRIAYSQVNLILLSGNGRKEIRVYENDDYISDFSKLYKSFW